jgi:hypothetical protein
MKKETTHWSTSRASLFTTVPGTIAAPVTSLPTLAASFSALATLPALTSLAPLAPLAAFSSLAAPGTLVDLVVVSLIIVSLVDLGLKGCVNSCTPSQDSVILTTSLHRIAVTSPAVAVPTAAEVHTSTSTSASDEFARIVRSFYST